MDASAIRRWAWVLLLAAGFAAGTYVAFFRHGDSAAGRPSASPVRSATQPATRPNSPGRRAARLAARPALNARSARRAAPPVAESQPTSAPAQAGGETAEPRNPEARQALSLVGLDPAAEEVWAQAINDPTLPAQERKSLIEDLNAAGFADPDNPTVDDLPLIESRLALIEQLAPAAMDEVNAAAFAAAYDDLLTMYDDLTGP